MITDFEELKEEVRSSLPLYLNDIKVEPNANGFFSCLNPEHDDSSPSMHLTPDKQHVKCFGCNATYDTVDLAAIKEGISTDGEEFVDALKSAADTLCINYSLKAPSAEEVRNAIFYSAYELVAHSVSNPDISKSSYTKATLQHIEDRGWDLKTLSEMGIGCIDESFIKDIPGLVPKDSQDPSTWLQRHDFKRTPGNQIFSKERLVFTLFNERGKPCGFTSRLTSDANQPKYNNTSSSIVPIFDKAAQLYHYHTAKKAIRQRALEELYIFEGQPDVVTAHHVGLINCIALGTSSLTDDQLHLIKKSGATKIILCLDGDEAGKKGVLKILTEKLKEFVGLRVYVKELPDGADPDDFIRTKGREEFHKLSSILAIDWILSHYKGKKDPEELAEFMVPMIASFSSAIEREGLCKKVALATDLSTTTILDDVNTIVHKKENDLKSQIMEIGDDLIHSLKKNPDRAGQILDKARERVVSIESEHETDHLGGDFFAESVLRFREISEAYNEEFPGFNLPMMPGYQQAFDNDWSTGKALYIGGDENCLTVETPVKVPNGWRPIGELSKDDLVMAVDGSWSKVTEIHRPGRRKLYKLNFNDGTSVISDADHRWGVMPPSSNTVHVKTTIEILLSSTKWRIPYAAPYRNDKVTSHKISSYMLGLLLGDGYLNQTPKLSFSKKDSKELLGYIGQDLKSLSITPKTLKSNPYMHVLSQNGTSKKSKHHCPNDLKNELKRLGLYKTTSHNKFIPIEYLDDGSVESRLSLLQGLLDSDGTIGVPEKKTHKPKVEFYTVSETLKNNVLELVRSLGGRATESKTLSRSRDKEGNIYTTGNSYIVRITLPPEMCPFRLKRKASIWKAHPKGMTSRYISGIDVLDSKAEVACISIDHPSKLFVIKDYIVTHNTGKTSFSCFKMINLVIPEAENNLRGIYMTIDDSVQELYNKFICILAKYYTRGYRDYHNGFDLEINHIVRPKYWRKVLREIDPQLEKDMLYAYKVGYDHLLQLARQEKLIMIGVPNSRNLPDFRKSISRLRKNYPDDNIWAYLDNVHKLPLSNGDARLGFKEASNDIKNMSVEYGCAVGGTLEYNTSRENRGKDGRPTNNSLAESRAFRYDASALTHMYNNLHVKGSESIFHHTIEHPWYHTPLKAPVVEAIIGKNKISSNKMPHFFKMYPGSSWFEYQNREEAIADADEKLNALKEKEARSAGANSLPDVPGFDNTNFGKREAIVIA